MWSVFSFSSLVSFSQGGEEFSEYAKYGGERLVYRVSYGGWFTLGRSTIEVDSTSVEIRGEKHINAMANIKITWLLSLINSMDDKYRVQLRMKDLRPAFSETHTERKGKPWIQKTFFDYDSMQMRITNHSSGEVIPHKHWELPISGTTYDIVGSFLLFREVNWNDMKIGDSLKIKTLEGHKVWDFGVEYGGLEYIKFQGERKLAYKIIGLFPITSTFLREKAVTFWAIQKGKITLPVLMEANLSIGKIKADLVDFNH
ncbi:MAG: DUF3108 domain-containing protein [Cyclobacteriaceae bacterium]